jgi:hypothetical protein
LIVDVLFPVFGRDVLGIFLILLFLVLLLWDGGGREANGVTTYRAIPQALALRGVPTARGGQWSPVHVLNILRRDRATA